MAEHLAFLRYDDLVGDWRAVADRLAATLGIDWPVEPEAAASDIETFLSGDLRHHAADPDMPLPAWAADGWAALLCWPLVVGWRGGAIF